MLKDKILGCESGIITYGITPPKQNNLEEKIKDITQRHLERLKHLSIDGLIIYDVQEEAERIDAERPFPFLPTINAQRYSEDYLSELAIPQIIYKCVGKYSEKEFKEWLALGCNKEKYSVFVGASSSKQKVSLKLNDAYELTKKANTNLILGGVAIPERHIKRNDEHLRIIEKTNNGCKYFVTQLVYNVEASKNFLSDYYYFCKHHDLAMVPILFTLTPCGSLKTVEFMKWLGINIPKWLENELLNSEDILDKSIQLLKKQFEELFDFAAAKQIPIGCNIESVSVRKVEIEASIQLVNEIGSMLK